MKLYKIWQEVNNSYDTYDSAIVCAKDEEEAKTISPDEWSEPYLSFYDEEQKAIKNKKLFCSSWAGINDIKVEYIGEATKGIEKGVILASFNTG